MKVLFYLALILLLAFLITCHGDNSMSNPLDKEDEEILVSVEGDEFREQLNENEKPVFDCLSKLTSACATEALGTIFFKGHITRGCCLQMVKVGLECYKTVVEHDLHDNPKVRDNPTWRSTARSKANLLWMKCALAFGDQGHLGDIIPIDD